MIKYLRKKKEKIEISRDFKNLAKERRKEKKEKKARNRRKSRKVKRNQENRIKETTNQRNKRNKCKTKCKVLKYKKNNKIPT